MTKEEKCGVNVKNILTMIDSMIPDKSIKVISVVTASYCSTYLLNFGMYGSFHHSIAKDYFVIKNPNAQYRSLIAYWLMENRRLIIANSVISSTTGSIKKEENKLFDSPLLKNRIALFELWRTFLLDKNYDISMFNSVKLWTVKRNKDVELSVKYKFTKSYLKSLGLESLKETQ